MSRSQSQLTLSTEEISSLLRAFPQGVVAVDLETTGLSPLVDKIIEIAAVKVEVDGTLSTFHSLINPLIDIPEFTIQFHGLHNEDVQNAPTIKKPLKAFWEFVGKHPMIAHNASFDLGYLIKASHDYLLDFPSINIYDTCRFSRAVYKGKENAPLNFKLSTLCDYYQIPLHHHVALEDTLACMKVMASSLREEIELNAMLERSFVFRLSTFQKSECFNFSTRLNGLKDLVQQKALVTLDYRGGSKQGKIRPVRPIGLMPLPQGAVLFAECLISGMNKSFLLKKIKSYSKLEASYWRPGV